MPFDWTKVNQCDMIFKVPVVEKIIFWFNQLTFIPITEQLKNVHQIILMMEVDCFDSKGPK